MSALRVLKDNMRILLDDATQATLFGPDFFRDLARAKLEREKTSTRLLAFHAILLAFLVLSTIPISTQINVFGLSLPNTDQLKEVVLFLSAVVGIVTTFYAADIAEMQAVLEVLLERKAGTAQAREILALPYMPYLLRGLPPVRQSPEPAVVESRLISVWYVATGMFLLLLVLVTYVISVGLHLYIVVDIAHHPSLPWHWSWIVVAYVIATDLFGFMLLMLMRVPLPYHSYDHAFALEELRKSDPTAWSHRIDELVAYYGKPWWHRLVLRNPAAGFEVRK